MRIIGSPSKRAALVMSSLVVATILMTGCQRSYSTTERTDSPRQSGSGNDTSDEGANPSGNEMLAKLSAGVALPQMLPNGTQIGFSVDYRFGGSNKGNETQYYWIIEPDQGEPYAEPVQLSDQGTLQTFVPWMPGDGPFRCYLAKGSADGTHVAISPSIALK